MDSMNVEGAAPVVAYLTEWCTDCMRARQILKRSGVAFTAIDVESVSGAEESMRARNGGSSKVPTIVVKGAHEIRVLVEPSDSDLLAALAALKREARVTS